MLEGAAGCSAAYCDRHVIKQGTEIHQHSTLLSTYTRVITSITHHQITSSDDSSVRIELRHTRQMCIGQPRSNEYYDEPDSTV